MPTKSRKRKIPTHEEEVNTLYNEYVRVFENKLGTGITTSSQLNTEGEITFGDDWRGVFAQDSILPKDGLYIVNTDRKGESGTHWMAVNANANLLYDSYGRSKKKVLSQWKGEETEHDAEQSENEFNCGQRSLAWLLVSMSFPEFAAMI